MSNYRDDLMDAAGLTDHTWSQMYELVVDSAVIADQLTFNLMIVSHDQATLADDVMHAVSYQFFDSVVMADSTSSQLIAYDMVSDSAYISDRLALTTTEIVEDSVYLADQVFSRIGIDTYDSIVMSESWQDFKQAYTQMEEKFSIRDELFSLRKESIDESAFIADDFSGIMHAYDFITDSVELTDITLETTLNYELISDVIEIHDSIFDRLYAYQRLEDFFYAEDEIVGSEQNSLLWTANTQNWAMSRYSGMQCEGLCVIDGELHAWNSEGLMKAQAGAEQIDAKLRTGVLNFGMQLVHPLGAYMDYVLDGADASCTMGVTSTQSGQHQTYFYPLQKVQAGALTNGRFVFGRGLRGNSFAFECKMSAHVAQIQTLIIDFAQTVRRI